VRLDVFATIDGSPVDNLARDEIELREDGVLQTIETFEHVQVPTPAASAGTPAGVPPSSSSRARVFVVFLDTYHTPVEASSNLRLPLVRFLDRALAEGDLVALLTPEMSIADITFVGKAAVLSNIMQPDWSWGRRGGLTRQDPKETLYDSCYAQGADGGSQSPAREMKARRREKLTLEALDVLVARLGNVRDERKAVLAVTDGWELFHAVQPASQSSRRRPPSGDTRRRDEPDERDRAQGVSRIECETDRAALAALDHSSRLIELGEEASRGLISFYPISPAALLSAETTDTADRSRARTGDVQLSAARLDSMRFLADGTDGVAVTDGRQAAKALQRIVEDQSSYYLVSYVSTNAKLDGRLRSITVRSTRPDVKLRTRRGYRGRSADDLLRGSASSSTVPTPNTNARAAFRIRASSWASPGTGEDAEGAFWIVGELDYRVRRELAWTAGAQADVTVLAADGTELVSRTVDVPAADGGFGLRVPEDSGLKPGDYAVRVRVRPSGADDLALTDSARVIVPAGRPALGEAVMWRRGPSTGPRYLMTADARFQRSDRMRLELPTAVEGTASARMLDRTGKPIRVPVTVGERPDASGRFRWITADVALAPLTMGEYAIEVTLGNASQVTPFRLVP
jgi:VWFA-related protein